jgi:CRISPR/Cas system-associated exonuclease Cas4 (RecB family)
MKTIRASDIGSYLYCRRAWWYRLNGQESANRAEMAAGTELHRRHGRQVLAAGFFRSLAWLALLVALVLGAVYLTNVIIARP